MKQSRFPKGWDEKRVSELLAHYETQTENGIVAEDEAILLDPEQTTMEAHLSSCRRYGSLSPNTRMLPEQPNQPLQPTANPLRGLSAAEVGR